MSGTVTRRILRAIDSAARILPRKASVPQHLNTGRRGEEEAYFHLRRQGYVMVARNYRSPNSRSELDLVGWDGETLCFVEVKTRTTHHVKPAEAAVDEPKQRDLSGVAVNSCARQKGIRLFASTWSASILSRDTLWRSSCSKNAFTMA